ncbi:MAG: ATP-binding protein [Nitrosomonadales bacterium]|nr:ATP-binding protein [Nitrosomonadales bacterium]
MLIEFSVSNYRSIREKQTFSMVAAPRLGKKGNVIKPKVKGEKIPNLLKVAAIYGPNASGKSNLIKAFGIFKALETLETSEPLPVSPFRFDPKLASEPSRFEFHFIAQNQRYEFRLAATSDRIIEETLISYPLGVETLLFSRHFTPSSGDRYQFGDALEGGEVVHTAWKNLTSSRQLFIIQATNNSSEELQQLRIPFSYLSNGVRVVSRDLNRLSSIALALARDVPALKFESYISSLLNELDVPISDVKIEKIGDSIDSLDSLLKAKDSAADRQKVHSSIFKDTKTTLTHKTALGEATFDVFDESDGTVNLIGFALPWMLMTGTELLKTLIVDELDSSLHPKIVARLIEKILREDKASQLIFSTHDTHLMETKLLRRDQLWITERNMNGATRLRSVHDFEGRESEDVEKRYYEGKYRGLPSLL